MHHVESQWIKNLLWFCVKGLFCVLENNLQEIFYWSWWKKTKQLYVLPTLVDYYSVIRSFDLWMSKGAYDIFTIVINFWGAN
jgi:hypothetical protein